MWGGRWKPGVVEEVCDEPRSYVVQSPDGGAYRRNQRHIRQSEEPDHVFESGFPVSLGAPVASGVGLEELSCEPGEHVHTPGIENYVTRSGRVSRPPTRLSY